MMQIATTHLVFALLPYLVLFLHFGPLFIDNSVFDHISFLCHERQFLLVVGIASLLYIFGTYLFANSAHCYF